MPVDWVAEIGSAHKGIPALAHELIRQFSGAGATICKFQLGWSKSGPRLDGHHSAFDNFKRIDEWADRLAEWCTYFGVEFMASIWSEDALDLALSLGMRRLKIAHQLVMDQKQKPLLDKIVNSGRPIFMSGAMPPSSTVRAVYVQDEYPVFRPQMPMEFGESWWYGYSSHAPGIADALIAVARGALYVEKHVTLDKTEHSVRDNHFALLPDEFAEMVRIGSDIRRAL